eukprot:2994172-Prymnesium_polylepis.1
MDGRALSAVTRRRPPMFAVALAPPHVGSSRWFMRYRVHGCAATRGRAASWGCPPERGCRLCRSRHDSVAILVSNMFNIMYSRTLSGTLLLASFGASGVPRRPAREARNPPRATTPRGSGYRKLRAHTHTRPVSPGPPPAPGPAAAGARAPFASRLGLARLWPFSRSVPRSVGFRVRASRYPDRVVRPRFCVVDLRLRVEFRTRSGHTKGF